MAQAATLTGRIIKICKDFFFIRTELGEVFYAHQDHLHGGQEVFAFLHRGDWVTFTEHAPNSGGHRHRRAEEIYHAASVLVAASEPPTEFWPGQDNGVTLTHDPAPREAASA